MIIEDGIKISHYKCFGQEGKGFDKIFPINIIIGKNNSGKSTLIDIIQYLMDIEKFKRVELRNGEKCNLIIKTKLTQDHIKTIPASTQGGGIPGPSHHQYAQGMLGKEFQYYVVNEHERKMLAPENFFMTDALKYIANIEQVFCHLFMGRTSIG